MQEINSGVNLLRDALRLLRTETDSFINRRLGLALTLVVGSSVLGALAPIAYKLLIDAYSPGGLSSSITPALALAAYVASQYLLRVLAAVRQLAHTQGEQRLYRHMSRRLFAHVVSLPLKFHLDRQTGAVGETLTQGLSGYQIVLQHLLYTLLPVVIELVAIAGVLVHLHHTVYLAILGCAAIGYALAFSRGAASITEPARAISSAHIDAHAVLTDTLLNYETVKYFDAESIVTQRYDSALAQTESAWLRYFGRITWNGLIVASIFAASLGTCLMLAGHEVVHGTMTVGDLVLINSYVLRLVQPLEQVGYAVRDISQGLSFLQRMLDLFAEKSESAAGAAHRLALVEPVAGALEFDHVSFGYRAERTILKDVSFRIPAGASVAIVGMSGSGKSSLIRLLFRLYEADTGSIRLDGVPVSHLALSRLRQLIAVVPQDTVLFNDTLGNNIGFGKPGASRAEVERAAQLAHLHEFIASLPEGYDTRVGERGLKLSGGEKQRVAIARAALKQPRIFVFDEATSSLDSQTEREILRNLIEVAQARTTLIIAHRLSTVVRADEILVLHEGVIQERGDHAQLLAREGRYAALWRAQLTRSSQQRDPPALHH